MPKRRTKKRREPPQRLDQRLTAIDRDLVALERELQQLLQTRADASAALTGEVSAAPGAVVGEPPYEPPVRPHAVPEAEVRIIRREGAPRIHPKKPAAADAQQMAAPPTAGQLHAPRTVFSGTVEEASVVIIRRTPREPAP